MPTALITGASSGIGEAFADVFASHGFDVVLTARREDRLRAVAARVQAQYGRRAEIIVADMAQRDTPARIQAELEARGIAVDALVNNAGYGVPGVYTASPWERHDAMLQVMVVGLSDLTHRLAPGMVERRYGRIINVASLAGLVPAPAGHTLYGASKALVIKFSEALSHELAPLGVQVTALCPGFTWSEFHDVTGTRDKMNKLPKWVWQDALTVAREGYAAVMAGKPIHIPGRVNRGIALLVRYMPQWIVTSVGRRFGKAYRKT